MNNGRDDTGRNLSTAFLEAHPREAAIVLESLAVEDAASILDSVTPEVAGPVLQEMTMLAGANCLMACSDDQAGRILATLPPDECVRLLRGLGATERDQLLAETEEETRETLSTLLQHPENTAGAMMDPRVLALPEDLTIAEARKRARRDSRVLRYYVYVTRRDQTLVGTLTLRELMLARGGALVSEVARRPVERIGARASRKTVLTHPAWQHVHAMPVVDDRDRLVGVIRYETIRELEASVDGEKPRDAMSLALALGELYWLGATAVTRQVFEALSRPSKPEEENDV